jgi:hypothetical protein
MPIARPHGVFSTGFDLVDGEGVVASFDGSSWRERGEVHVADRTWDLRREGGRRFVLADQGGEVATLERVSWWSGAWRLDHNGRSLPLTKPSIWSRTYRLTAGDAVVGEVRPASVWRRESEVRMPPDLPVHVQVFVVAVVLTLWRREQSSASAGATAGG